MIIEVSPAFMALIDNECNGCIDIDVCTLAMKIHCWETINELVKSIKAVTDGLRQSKE